MSPQGQLSEASQHARLVAVRNIIFLDFDGVIKDSVDAKGLAFVATFRDFGHATGERILAHHRSNGGMSRTQKIPLYLEWVGLPTGPATVERFNSFFAAAARRAVIDSPWVPGALEYLERRRVGEVKVIVSATPEQELRSIAEELGIANLVDSIFGAPMRKVDAIRREIRRLGARAGDCIMIGDSMVDLEAAAAAEVPFILRRHDGNRDLERVHQLCAIDDLREIWSIQARPDTLRE
jgi:phosphoglycolate phosphatase-like HAD superfamily hydrolase